MERIKMTHQNEPWELQNAEDSYTPLEPGESHNMITLASCIVLIGMFTLLWML